MSLYEKTILFKRELVENLLKLGLFRKENGWKDLMEVRDLRCLMNKNYKKGN